MKKSRHELVTVIIGDAHWRRHRRAAVLVRKSARLTLGLRRAHLPVTILLTSDARMKALNWQFRGRKKPTNVLSFTSSRTKDYLGDVALGYGTVAREAKAQGKEFAFHAAHLAAHGVLHLMGHDHDRPDDAAHMEKVEIRLLAKLGIPDPYAEKRKPA